ncbi:MAG: hypothetical protein KJ573_17105 [Proteobacteria bacterium]|nr:hypothetical protein [Pseudomonadota bacterium]
MADILCFSRNNATTVEQLDDETMVSSCRLQDTLTDLFVEMRVKTPHLEITEIHGEIRRPSETKDPNIHQTLRKVIGTRVGPGIKKIVKGLMGETATEKKLVFMIGECCNGIILSFTKQVLLAAPTEKRKEREFFAAMVENSPRLYNSCAALSPESPLMDGIEPP